MTRSVIITQKVFNNRTVFGITVEENGISDEYPVITENEEKAEQLKRNLADSDISAVHIRDIIKDLIAEEACDKLLESSLL